MTAPELMTAEEIAARCPSLSLTPRLERDRDRVRRTWCALAGDDAHAEHDVQGGRGAATWCSCARGPAVPLGDDPAHGAASNARGD